MFSQAGRLFWLISRPNVILANCPFFRNNGYANRDMTGISKNGRQVPQHDFDLGIEGFRFYDLFDASKLKELAERFYSEIENQEPVLHKALMRFISARGSNYEPKVASKILTDSAPFLSEFVARL